MSANPTTVLTAAGSGLSAGHIQWGQRKSASQLRTAAGLAVTDRDLHLLRALHDYGYLTTRLAAVLFWGHESTAVRRRLHRLHEHGLIDKLRPRTSLDAGTREWIYRLTEHGWRYLLRTGRAADGEDYTPPLIDNISYVEHDLQLAATITHLLQCVKSSGIATAPAGLLAQAPFEWLGARRGRVDPWNEPRATHPSAGSQLPDEYSLHPELSRRGAIVPDATLTGVEAASSSQTAVLIEYDRTRRASKQLERFRRYDYFLTQGWRETRYASLEYEPAVIFLCDTDQQVSTFVRAADQHLTAWIGPHRASPQDGTYPGREQTVFTSRQRIARDDWIMLQVPRLPPNLRARVPGQRAICEPRQHSLPLHRLFAHPSA